MLSCSIDFYIRVFIRVFNSPAEVKKNFWQVFSSLVFPFHSHPSTFFSIIHDLLYLHIINFVGKKKIFFFRIFSKSSYLYVFSGCKSFYLQPLAKMLEKGTFGPMTGPVVDSVCENCENKFHVKIIKSKIS